MQSANGTDWAGIMKDKYFELRYFVQSVQPIFECWPSPFGGPQISRVRNPLRRGDFQLMLQPISRRCESLGEVPLKRVSGTETLDEIDVFDTAKYSRAGADGMKRSSTF